jgi:hypothetical protein
VPTQGLRTWKDLPTSNKQKEGNTSWIVRLIINRMEFANVARTHRHSRPIFHRCSSSHEVNFDADFSFFAMQLLDGRTCWAGGGNHAHPINPLPDVSSVASSTLLLVFDAFCENDMTRARGAHNAGKDVLNCYEGGVPWTLMEWRRISEAHKCKCVARW